MISGIYTSITGESIMMTYCDPDTIRDERDKLKAENERLRAERDKLEAENERMRAEVERFRFDGASAVRWAPSSAYWSEVLKELFGPHARDGIDALERRWRVALECADTAEALLRQALEALEHGAWDTLSGRNAAYAIREHLGLDGDRQ